jgi:hypothetical protein
MAQFMNTALIELLISQGLPIFQVITKYLKKEPSLQTISDLKESNLFKPINKTLGF